jgi:hypothetical protein
MSIQDQKAMSEMATVVEQLADIEHQRWSDWQKWCNQVLRENNSSPEQGDILERWDRQIETPYSELSESEKESDREQVRRYLPIILALKERWTREARLDELKMLIPKPVAEMISMDYQDELYRTFDGIRDRVAQLGGKE